MDGPVFGHGQLRLYLLHTLSQETASGYDVMRRLADRFGGLYSPSAGTVYPRLAKLEEEGLVRRREQGRRTTFELTDAGRAELAARQDDVEALDRRLDEAHRRLTDEMRTRVETGAAHLRDELESAARLARDAADPAAERTNDDTTARPESERPWGRRGTDWSDLARWFAYAAGDSLGRPGSGRGGRGEDGSAGAGGPTSDHSATGSESRASADPGAGRERMSFEGAGIPSPEAWTDILAILRDAAARIHDRLEADPPEHDEG